MPAELIRSLAPLPETAEEVRRVGQRLVLEGKMTEGDAMAVGRTVSLILRLQGNDVLFGYGDSFLAGARSGGGISLRKAASAAGG